jgi:queuine tRNA-ribosyltransferase subunit QTRTD1
MAGNCFHTIKTAASTARSMSSGARAGILKLESVKPIQTPGFLCPTSRGVITHLTPDNVAKCGSMLSGLVVNAEDFMEKAPAADIPLLKYPDPRELLALPLDLPMIITPRRPAPVPSPQPNRDDSISIMTGEGFRSMPLSLYGEFASRLSPDIVLSVPDIPNLSPGGKPGANRAKKMLARTEKWLKELLLDKCSRNAEYRVFAPILPGLSASAQRSYFDVIRSDSSIVGVTLWNAQAARLSPKQAEMAEKRHAAKKPLTVNNNTMESYLEELANDELVRCYASGIDTPHDVLDMISKGVDLFLASSAYEFTDSGVALDFTFPANMDEPVFGYNLWDDQYAADMGTLGRVNSATIPGTSYNRAYIHHLLGAREMTGWVLLQMHNLAVFSSFFDGVRKCILDGTFEVERENFFLVYGDPESARELRDKFKRKDTVPKVRGYAISYDAEVSRKQEGSTQRLNDPPFRKL